MYKVFIQNKPLFFIEAKKISEFEGVFLPLSLACSNRDYVLSLVAESAKSRPIILFSNDVEAGIRTFFSAYDFVEAAGGIVKRKDKYLAIKRNGVWDLPKGKIDEGEDSATAAHREIEEECGISCDGTGKLIALTYHVYPFKGMETLKKTYWFEMDYSGDKKLTPQAEEGITKAKWFEKDGLMEIRGKMYPSLLDVLDTYFGA